MPAYPIEFISQAKAGPGVASPWALKSGAHVATGAVPSEFGGGGGGFSPEDLYAQALANCFIGTFKVYAQASKVAFEEVEVVAHLEVDQGENRQPVMARCRLDITISGADRPDRVETLVQKAMKSGFVLNSVKTELTYELALR
jgi:organic hydroperoxide reductase OsmC/OhrA